MTQYDIWPTRRDIAGIDRLEKLVLEAGAGEASDLEREVLIIGEIIDENAVRLGGETIVRFQNSKPEFATLHAGLADID